MLIPWRESFVIDGGVIDDDHRFLFMSINTIIRRLTERLPVSYLVKRTLDLRILAALHFEREERLQEWSGYPDLAAHRREHQELLARCDEILHGLQAEAAGAVIAEPAEIKTFLCGWILDHMILSDKKLKPFVTPLDSVGEAPLGQLRRKSLDGGAKPLFGGAQRRVA
ncbi:MAG TPA: hemerythrin family protein [Roseiarcus sp.]|nr:hemerythrin family protein [Roseiarcus sp.]